MREKQNWNWCSTKPLPSTTKHQLKTSKSPNFDEYHQHEHQKIVPFKAADRHNNNNNCFRVLLVGILIAITALPLPTTSSTTAQSYVLDPDSDYCALKRNKYPPPKSGPKNANDRGKIKLSIGALLPSISWDEWIRSVLVSTRRKSTQSGNTRTSVVAGNQGQPGDGMTSIKDGTNLRETLEPAIKLALADIRRHECILEGYHLDVAVEDTQCKGSRGIQSFFELMKDGQEIVGLFGDACTKVNQPIAETAKYWDLIQLSYAETHPIFDHTKQDKKDTSDEFSTFYRIVPSSREINVARLQFLQFFNWTRVGTLKQSVPKYAVPHDPFIQILGSNNIKVVMTTDFSTEKPNVTQGLINLKEKDVRILVGDFNAEFAADVFCEAYKQHFFGEKYVWILPGFYSDTWWKDVSRPPNCTEKQLKDAMNGSFVIDMNPNRESDSVIRGINNKTMKDYLVDYGMQCRAAECWDKNELHAYVYDGIWTMAIALDDVVRNFRSEKGKRFRPQDIRSGEVINATWFRTRFTEALNNVSFLGVTGQVKFTDNDRLGLIRIRRFVEGKYFEVGKYDGATKNLDLHDSISKDWNVPIDEIQTVEKAVHIKRELFFSMCSLATAGILLALIFLAINIRFRNHKYIRMSSPNMNNMMIVGSLFTYASVLLLGLDSRTVGVDGFRPLCYVKIWVLCLGFTLAFGSMFSKTWRVHSIFTNIKLNKKAIKDYQLFLLVGVLLIVDGLVLGIWAAISPTVMKKTKLVPIENDREKLRIVPYVEECSSDQAIVFQSILYCYKGLLLLLGCFLAWETRHVNVPALNDSKYIGMSVYNVVLMSLLGVSLSFVLDKQIDESYCLTSFFIIFATTLTLALVFGPKIVELARNPKGLGEKKYKHGMLSGGHHHNKGVIESGGGGRMVGGVIGGTRDSSGVCKDEDTDDSPESAYIRCQQDNVVWHQHLDQKSRTVAELIAELKAVGDVTVEDPIIQLRVEESVMESVSSVPEDPFGGGHPSTLLINNSATSTVDPERQLGPTAGTSSSLSPTASTSSPFPSPRSQEFQQQQIALNSSANLTPNHQYLEDVTEETSLLPTRSHGSPTCGGNSSMAVFDDDGRMMLPNSRICNNNNHHGDNNPEFVSTNLNIAAPNGDTGFEINIMQRREDPSYSKIINGESSSSSKQQVDSSSGGIRTTMKKLRDSLKRSAGVSSASSGGGLISKKTSVSSLGGGCGEREGRTTTTSIEPEDPKTTSNSSGTHQQLLKDASVQISDRGGYALRKLNNSNNNSSNRNKNKTNSSQHGPKTTKIGTTSAGGGGDKKPSSSSSGGGGDGKRRRRRGKGQNVDIVDGGPPDEDQDADCGGRLFEPAGKFYSMPDLGGMTIRNRNSSLISTTTTTNSQPSSSTSSSSSPSSANKQKQQQQQSAKSSHSSRNTSIEEHAEDVEDDEEDSSFNESSYLQRKVLPSDTTPSFELSSVSQHSTQQQQQQQRSALTRTDCDGEEGTSSSIMSVAAGTGDSMRFIDSIGSEDIVVLQNSRTLESIDETQVISGKSSFDLWSSETPTTEQTSSMGREMENILGSIQNAIDPEQQECSMTIPTPQQNSPHPSTSSGWGYYGSTKVGSGIVITGGNNRHIINHSSSSAVGLTNNSPLLAGSTAITLAYNNNNNNNNNSNAVVGDQAENIAKNDANRRSNKLNKGRRSASSSASSRKRQIYHHQHHHHRNKLLWPWLDPNLPVSHV